MLQMSLNSCFHLPENQYACSMCALDAYSKRTNEFLFVNSLVLQQNCNLLLFHFVLQLFSHVNIKPFLNLLLSFFFTIENLVPIY